MYPRRIISPFPPLRRAEGTGRPRAAGFTLIELIVIIVIAGIITAVILSAIDLSGSSALSESDALASHLRYAQSRAMKSGGDWGIRCQGGSYWLFRGDDPDADLVVLPGESDDTVQLSDKKVTVSNFTVIFDQFGVPRDASDVRLTGDLTITVTASDGSSRSLVITQETGYVS